MQFVVIAYDGEDALKRRMATRDAHLSALETFKQTGNVLCAAAMKNQEGQPMGSVVVTNFESRKEFDAWLAHEPYVLQNVWGDITVHDAALAPQFSHLIK